MTKLYKQEAGNGFLIFLTLLALIISSCTPAPSPPTPTSPFPTPVIPDIDLPITSRDLLVGTAGLVPPHFPDPSGDDYLEFLAELPHTGEIVGVYIDWSAPDLINSILFAETQAEGVDPDQVLLDILERVPEKDD